MIARLVQTKLVIGQPALALWVLANVVYLVPNVELMDAIDWALENVAER